MHHLRSANPKRKATEGTVRRSMRIRPHKHEAGLRNTLLRRHNMQNALLRIAKAKQLDPVTRGIRLEQRHHVANLRIRNTANTFIAVSAGYIVITKSEYLVGPVDGTSLLAQHREG